MRRPLLEFQRLCEAGAQQAFALEGPDGARDGPMLRELYRHPEKGSFEDLERFARIPDDPYLPAWRRFNRMVGADGSVSIWHETYIVQLALHQRHLHPGFLVGQSDAPSFFEAVSGRSHNETWAGCMVSRTTLTSSLFSASKSVSSLSLAEKASRVLAASYFLR
jgi:fumigallin biosynthesis monooxygenase-like protein